MDWLERFRAKYKPLLKDKYDEFEYGLSCQKKRHLRVQVSRGIDYLSEISESVNVTALNGYSNMYQVQESENSPVDTISFQTGGVYIMNPSSLTPAEILMSFMPDEPVMLDVSSAPGGKTCALSDLSARKGLIVANEISSSRLKSLHFNLEKYGAYNVKTVSMDGRLLQNYFDNSFDGILLDAPCSNENKIFRNKTVQSAWNDELVDRMAELQRQLIKSAFNCLKEGGVLVYSTCTLSLEENELVIKSLLDEYPDAELLSVQGSHFGGLSGISYIDEKVARILPEKDSIDGFFAAAVRKKGNLKPYIFHKTKLEQKQVDFFKKYYPGFDYSSVNLFSYDKTGYIETGNEIFSRIKFKRRGLSLYKEAGKNYEPACQSVWEFGQYIHPDNKFLISKENSVNYLKGFDILNINDYNNQILFYSSLPVGFSKVVNNSLKNKLDRYFLYGKNIEY